MIRRFLFVLTLVMNLPAARASEDYRLRTYRFQGAKILRDGAIERLLAKAQNILKRDLTDDEINARILELIEATGEGLSLEIEKPKKYQPGISGFSAIALADGDQTLMQSIRPGTKILSIDMFTGQRVENEVTDVEVYWDSKWRQYDEPDDLYPLLRASPHQLIFAYVPSPPTHRVIQLKTVDEARFGSVYKFVTDGIGGKELEPRSLGFEIRKSWLHNTQDMFSLTLAHEPRTFIANHHVLPDDELCRQALQ